MQDDSTSARPRVSREALVGIAALLTLLGILFVVWRYTPFGDALTPRSAAQWAREFGAAPWAPAAIMLAYTPASILMFPRPLISLAAVVAFGPWQGSAYALAGILLSALATYAAGLLVDRRTLRRHAGRRVFRVSRSIRRGGIPAFTAVRLVPIAPFAVINLVAGASRVRMVPFLVGTALGMTPGLIGLAVIGAGLRNALDAPATVDWHIVGGVALVAIAGSLILQRLARRSLPAGASSRD